MTLALMFSWLMLMLLVSSTFFIVLCLILLRIIKSRSKKGKTTNKIFPIILRIILIFNIVIFMIPIVFKIAGSLDYAINNDDKLYREMVDQVFIALDNGNKEELKKLFSESVIKTDLDLDNQIDALFEYYKGPKESDEGVGPAGMNGYNDHGKIKTELRGWFTVQASGVKHNVYLSMQSINDINKSEKGIHNLEFATDEAYNSKYFMWHTQEGIHIQTSSEKRSDVTKAESWMLDYTYVDRHLTSEDYLALVKEDNDFEHFTEKVGVANCSNPYYDRNYYELGDKLFLVCIVEFGKIEFVKLANEDKILTTLWVAPDRIMIEGEYRQYTPIDRKITVNEDFFKTFFLRSNKLEELIGEIGQPDGDNNNHFYQYYKISDNRFIVCECKADGQNIRGCYVADADNKLYTIWEENSNR